MVELSRNGYINPCLQGTHGPVVPNPLYYHHSCMFPMIRTMIPAIIAVAVLIGAPISAFAVKQGNINTNVINLTVNCANGHTIKKTIGHADINVNTGPVTVNCGGGAVGPKGDTGATGPAGKNGQNATITLCTDNSTNPVCMTPTTK